MKDKKKSNQNDGVEARDCVSKCTCVLIFGWTSSKPLIIFVINLMTYISGPPVNHLIDGSP
jgi:hypothetical protein